MSYITDNISVMERFTSAIGEIEKKVENIPADVSDKIRVDMGKVETQIGHMRELIKVYKKPNE